MLMLPLSLNLYTLILIGLSFLFKIGDMGVGLFVFLLLAVGAITLLFLKKIYITGERYLLVKIDYPVFYYLAAPLHLIISAIVFSISAYLLY